MILPNSNLAKEAILNYSEPSIPTRIEVTVGASYQTAPNVAKAAIPTVLVFQGGKEVDRLVGVNPLNKFKDSPGKLGVA